VVKCYPGDCRKGEGQFGRRVSEGWVYLYALNAIPISGVYNWCLGTGGFDRRAKRIQDPLFHKVSSVILRTSTHKYMFSTRLPIAKKNFTYTYLQDGAMFFLIKWIVVGKPP
jgi:hypothetical protein